MVVGSKWRLVSRSRFEWDLDLIWCLKRGGSRMERAARQLMTIDRGVHGCGSIREPTDPNQPNPLFTRTRSFAGRIRSNPPYPQAI
ncbi:hypothetical protein A2U01_0071671, partial [Trifolium medium]|nr:hypothetical protein [Trifolium medium]